jgi:hypothetical protein
VDVVEWDEEMWDEFLDKAEVALEAEPTPYGGHFRDGVILDLPGGAAVLVIPYENE